MPIQLPITDPVYLTTNPTGFAWADIVAFSARDKTMRLVYWKHPSSAAAYGGGQPYPVPVEIAIGPTAKDAEYGPAPMTDPGKPAVPPVYQTNPDGSTVLDASGNPVIVTPGTPAVPPTYGPGPLLRPRVPSYDEIVSAHQSLFASLADAVDAVAVAVAPEFALAGATVIPRAS